MKTFYKIILLTFLISCINTTFAQQNKLLSGQQPQLSIDNSGIIRMVYGEDDKIYCASSKDNGQSFPDIQLVATVKDMHLGMSRGPQLASSKNYSMIAAIDKKGSVHIFKLSHATGKWMQTGLANDITNSAPEGLMNIAADNNDNFFAVWLDTRADKKNKICFAKTTSQGHTWTANKMAYISPDKTVCECCKPSIAVNGSKVFIQFRNWLNGSRDLYLLSSDNGGNTFNQPVKLGNGTWKLKGCPMDGGGLVVSEKNEVTTVWRREDKIYYSKPGEPEIEIATGRNCSISNPRQPVITWQQGDNLKIKDVNKGDILEAGKGAFLKSISTKDNKIFCAWETDGHIAFARM
ncbi:MAG: hypothetical protein H7254_01800 [Ferruginibacter sp.]|nr:hypothetical protein [Ferruginibacter sp.]